MKNKIITVSVALALAAILACAYFLYGKLGEDYNPDTLVTESVNDTKPGNESPNNEGTPSNLAPDFTVTDAEGKEVKLSDFRGKPVVLNFWASWCGYCIKEMPEFDSKSKELDGKVQFMMVNCTDGRSETVETANECLEGKGYTFPVYYDTKMDASMTYGVSSLPITIFINADGEIVTYVNGMISETKFERGIELITG